MNRLICVGSWYNKPPWRAFVGCRCCVFWLAFGCWLIYFFWHFKTFFLIFNHFSSFFVWKFKKRCKLFLQLINAKKDDFDQQTVCEAHVCWSKYTKLWHLWQNLLLRLIHNIHTGVWNLPHKFPLNFIVTISACCSLVVDFCLNE